MAECFGIKSYDHENVKLAWRTSKSILQISLLLKDQETDVKLVVSYRQLTAHCIFVSDHINRIQTTLGPGHELIGRILHLFESIVAPYRTLGVHGELTTTYPKQHALNQRWKDLKHHSGDVRFKFIDQCLLLEEVTGSRYQQDIMRWEDDVISHYRENSEDWSTATEIRAEPSYTVWSAAQSVFDALTCCTKCECHPNEFDAKLCLGTYRNPDSVDPDSLENNEFHMFLSLQHMSQEVRVCTVRDTVVRFALTTVTRTVPEQPKYQPMLVKRMCEQIHKMQETPSLRLELKVESGQLWKLRSEKSTFQIDRERPPVSLQRLIAKGAPYITEKIRRILAVQISYAILHLHGTTWLQSTWDSSKILFFQTTSFGIPLRPFIQAELCDTEKTKEATYSSTDYSFSTLDRDDVDPDDLSTTELDPDDFQHPFPSLVTLAIILMELYFLAPFDELARNRNVVILDDKERRMRHIDVASVFEEYQNDIPRDSQLCHAIEKCLDAESWEGEGGQQFDNEVLRPKVYEEIIRPLEDYLRDGSMKLFKIEELDEYANMMDVASWWQVNQDHDLDAYSKAYPTLPSDGSLVHNPQQHQNIGESPPPSLTSGLEHASLKFYDDEAISGPNSQVQLQKYLGWKTKYMKVYEKFAKSHLDHRLQSPVKIAVLDTGVDETHNLLDTGQIKHKRNWVNKRFKKAVHDSDGHGTFTASLVAEYAPDAELYIAKIAEKEPSSPEIIAEALRFAVDDWSVDIISMSFGYPSRQIEGYDKLEEAILYAHSKNVLMFAAASNSGANLDRAYPARDPHVICIHSTDSDGNRSKFSPTALTHDLNIATIGESVESAWPVHLCDAKLNQDCLQCKSGTSYATPIMVGIAAFLLQYARIHLGDQAHLLKRQSKMKDVLLKVAEKTQKSVTRDGYDYVSLSLFEDNLFGKNKEFIDATLSQLLMG